MSNITRCVQYALKSLGIDEPDLDKLECYIGPPLIDSFQRYHGLSLEQAQIGVAKYRERFRDTGIFENEVIAGIPEVLEELKKRGYVMALATSKPEEFALRITKHFHLAQYFEIEVGSGMNGELKYKADVIAEVLRRIAQKHPEQDMAEIEADSVMIGDRVHDIEGAKKCKIESVGVRFGFAKPGELEEAGADEIVATPEELLELIGEQKTALRIRHLFLPVWMKGSEKENPFILAAQKAGIMVEYLKKGDEIRAGELTVSVLHPGAGEDYTGEENAGSVVLQLSCGACRALLTGDLEGSGEEEVLGAAERCQILKVAHHGSRNSTSEAFLNRIQPQISLISCAWPGRYGHPHRELLERLRACKSHIYGTPVDGAVTVQLKRDRLAVHGYRSDVEFPVS